MLSALFRAVEELVEVLRDHSNFFCFNDIRYIIGLKDISCRNVMNIFLISFSLATLERRYFYDQSSITGFIYVIIFQF